jgi:transposase
MRESIGIDSISGGPMPKPYSQDLRMRVIEAVGGGASRREAAELYGISPSVVVIWMQHLMATGSIEAKPIGGSTSPLDEHGEFLLGLTVERPDMTLDEIVAAMARAGIAGSRTAVWRFYERHNISFKKSLYAAEQKRAEVARERRRWMRQQGMFDPARLVFTADISRLKP